MADDEGQDADTTNDGDGEQAGGEQQSAKDVLGEAGKAAIAAERKARQDAERQRKVLERELEGYRQAAMSDQERAVAEAKASERATVTQQFGQRLAQSEFVAEARSRNPKFDARSVLEDLNIAKFVTDAGEPDTKAIASAVLRLIPAPDEVQSFDGGARTSASKPVTGNDWLRQTFQQAQHR